MNELIVNGNRFYILRIRWKGREEITLHNELASSIRKIKEAFLEEIDPKNIVLMSVEIKGDKFKIVGVPWSTIAVELVKEEF